jgi:hypothetical protein
MAIPERMKLVVARSVCVAAVDAEMHYQRLLIAAASVLAVRMQKKQAVCES